MIVDIDECTENLDNCHEKADCTDLEGSFRCTCKSGYEGDGVDSCNGKFDFGGALRHNDQGIVSLR